MWSTVAGTSQHEKRPANAENSFRPSAPNYRGDRRNIQNTNPRAYDSRGDSRGSYGMNNKGGFEREHYGNSPDKFAFNNKQQSYPQSFDNFNNMSASSQMQSGYAPSQQMHYKQQSVFQSTQKKPPHEPAAKLKTGVTAPSYNLSALPSTPTDPHQAERFKRPNNGEDLWSTSREQAESKKWRSRTVEERKKREQTTPVPQVPAQQQPQPKRDWWYLDPQAEIQGPFPEEEMRDWYNEGFFQSDLPVRATPNGEFLPLGDWFKGGNKAFLLEIPPEFREQIKKEEAPPQQSPKGYSARQRSPHGDGRQPSATNINLNQTNSLGSVIDNVQQRYIPPDTRQARPHSGFDSTPFDASHPSNHNNLPVQHNAIQQTPHSNTPPNQNVQASNVVTNHPRPNLVTNRFEQQTGVSHQVPKPFASRTGYGAANPENTQSPNRRDVNVLNMNHHFQQSHQPTSQSHQPASSFYSREANLLPVSTQSHASQNELQPNPAQHPNTGIISDMLTENQPKQEEKQNDVSQSQWTSVKSDIGMSTGSGLQRQEGNSSLSTPFGVNPALTGNQESYHSRFDQIKKDNKSTPWQKLDTANETKPKKDVNMISKQEMNSQIPSLAEERRANEPQQNIQRQRTPQTRQDAFSWGSSPNSMQMQRPQSAREKPNQISKQQRRDPNTMGKPMKQAGDLSGGKPRQSQGSWGQSTNAWGDRPPRIPHSRNNNSSNRASGWNNSSGSKEEKTNGSKSTNTNHGMRQGQTGRKPQQSRKQPISKSDPTLSSSHNKRSNSKTAKNSSSHSISNQNSKVSDANPFGVKISSDFEEWCTKEIKSLNSEVDARTLIHFLMTCEGTDEIKQYISIYLGGSKQTNEFADNFILHKRFEGNDSMQTSSKRRRGKKRGKRKGPQ